MTKEQCVSDSASLLLKDSPDPVVRARLGGSVPRTA